MFCASDAWLSASVDNNSLISRGETTSMQSSADSRKLMVVDISTDKTRRTQRQIETHTDRHRRTCGRKSADF